MKRQRYEKLDGIRGLALLNMIAYHTVWDLVYMYQLDWGWYKSKGAYVWQQGICWTFIFLSGFCMPLGKHTVKRGITIFMGGVIITLVTVLAVPQDRVVFGVLTFIGSCMLIVGLLDRWIKKLPPLPGIVAGILLFALTRNVNEGCLGFERFSILELPAVWYANLFTTYLGFMKEGFYSTDYFSLFPWVFLFMTGYFVCRCLDGSKSMEMLQSGLSVPLEWLGKHSFEIYMLHQPLIYLSLQLVFAVL